ncbi:sulfatase-like hydrolase/transferase [Aquimarina sp. AU119]|uniref:sulfatase-like hydrolase/transferase n=1 Tax=Aquimarina sp. AU119 TaxID=2108528 RepID=UPI000D68BE15|nr:sulfatase-like hydrolase/transferase [Aquimarina sp. AU119]
MNKLVALFFLIFLVGCSKPEKTLKKKPNVVFIFADDLTYSAIHALGNTEIQTPNLDRLVEGGTTFTHAYNMGAWNGAVCAASRAMIISGRSVWNVNQFRQNWSNGRELDKTWGKLMESQGYTTYMTGKWHVDAKADSVFQNVTHVRPGMPGDAWDHFKMVERFENIKGTDTLPKDIMPIGYNRPTNENDTIWSPSDPKFGGYWEGGKHWSEVLKDDALTFIDKAKKEDNPFFMYLAFNAPHDPRQAPQEYIDKYPLESISLPKSWLAEYPFKDGMGNAEDLRDEALAPFPRTEYATKKHIQEYYALITHMDDQIGEILNTLEKTGEMDNTYIIFTADHGLAMGKHGLIGKQSLFDHSIRAPFMIMGPDIPKGKKIEEDIYLQDAMATSIELAGVDKPEYVEFNSILDMIHKEGKSSYEAIYGAYIDLQRMIRKDGYKLIIYPKMDKVLLYDMQKDPEEMKDLATNPNYRAKVDELFKALITIQKQKKDPLDLEKLYKQITISNVK